MSVLLNYQCLSSVLGLSQSAWVRLCERSKQWTILHPCGCKWCMCPLAGMEWFNISLFSTFFSSDGLFVTDLNWLWIGPKILDPLWLCLSHVSLVLTKWKMVCPPTVEIHLWTYSRPASQRLHTNVTLNCFYPASNTVFLIIFSFLPIAYHHQYWWHVINGRSKIEIDITLYSDTNLLPIRGNTTVAIYEVGDH